MNENRVKFIFLSVFFIIIIIFTMLLMLTKESSHTENNILKYYLMTPSVITNTPKASENYSFSYTPDDNYGYEHYSVDFKSVKNPEQKKLYLKNIFGCKNPTR